MTAAQLTFWVLVVGLSLGLTLFFYPGVRRHAQSSGQSLLASLMAAALCATGLALSAAFVVNAVGQLTE